MRAASTSATVRSAKILDLQRFPAIYDRKTILIKLNEKARGLDPTDLQNLRKLVREFETGDKVKIDLYPISREQWFLISPPAAGVYYFMDSRQNKNTTIRGKVLGYTHKELIGDITFSLVIQTWGETPILIPIGGANCDGFICADAPNGEGKEIFYDDLPVLSIKKSSK